MNQTVNPKCETLAAYVQSTVAEAVKGMGVECIPYCTAVGRHYGETPRSFDPMKYGPMLEGGLKFELTHPERKRKIKLSVIMSTEGYFHVSWFLDDPDSLEKFIGCINNALRIANCVEMEQRGNYSFKTTVEDSRGYHLSLRVKRALENSGIYADHAAEMWTLDGSMWAAGQPVGAMQLKVTNLDNEEGLIIFMHSESGGWTVMFVHDWFFDPVYEAIRISSEKRFHDAIRKHKLEIEAI